MKKSFLAFIALLGLAFIVVTPSISMAAMDIFVFVEGVPGESMDDQHKDWIDGLSYFGGVVNDGVGKSCFNDISITKRLDKSSPTLALYTATSANINEVTIEFCRVEDLILKVELLDAHITSISSGGSAGDDFLTEDVKFAFGKIQWTYRSNSGEIFIERVNDVVRCIGGESQ
jgi:type VI secretion system secreted protein Hcp